MLTTNHYSYSTVFKIDSENSLNDFWSYLIFRLHLDQSEKTYDRFARLYNRLNENIKFISIAYPITITLKESAQHYFLYIETELTSILEKIIQRLTLLKFEFFHKENFLSYAIEKKHVKSIQKVPTDSKPIYDFIIQDDLENMIDILEKLQDMNYEKVYNSLVENELNSYRTSFSYYASFLKYYPQLDVISNSVAELSVILSLYTEDCLKLGKELRILLRSFLNNLIYWQDKLFIHGGEKLEFMDDSFKADLSQIKIALKLFDELEEDTNYSLDDIFDF